MTSSLPELLARVLPLALGAAVSPVIVLLQMVTLTSGTARLRRAWLVAAGAAVALIGWAVAGWLLVNHLPTPRRGPDPTAGAVDLTLALVLVALGLRSLAHRHDPAPVPAPSTAADSAHAGHLAAAFGLGLVAMASNVTTIVLFLPAVRDIARADVTTLDTAVALLVLLAACLGKGVACWAAARRAVGPADRARRWRERPRRSPPSAAPRARACCRPLV